MRRYLFGVFALAVVLALPLPVLAQNTTGLVVGTCGSVSPAFTAGRPGPFTVGTDGQLCVTGTFSASIAGFAPATTGTPISVTTGGVTGTLPAGAVVIATNVGTTNAAYCKLGASATTSDQYISPNGGWFAFTVGVSTQLTCITSTSTTTVNMVGGAGLATGTGGGGGGSGGSVTQGTSPWVVGQATAASLNATVVGTGTFATQSAITAASGSIAPGAMAAGSMVDLLTMRGTKAPGTAAANALLAGGIYTAAGVTLTDGQQAALQQTSFGSLVSNPAAPNATTATWNTSTALNTVVTVANAQLFPANQISLSASALVTAGAVTFQGTKADGTDETIPVAQVLNPNTLAPLTNPYTLTTSKQDFLIVTQGYQAIKVKLTTAITASGGAATTVISSTNVPYNPVISALLNPLAAGSAIIGKVGIDQTTPGTTNKVALASDIYAYETVAASQTAQAMGATGATGDYLSHCIATPGTTSPGVVTVLDNATAVVSFAGGASSVSNLVPFTIPIGALSVSGAWKITTGANVTVVCVGRFT